ncbi:hypothetical protein OB955_03725 [Halobacteria archaeon AArc-m2/3/4]|uniref:Uncharacterized protein n=1 Tax=Natronoglomus mannanivorans TaxID=2979990 RepID=A0ABT2QAA6_9EURY|nr:hypothetical protein [Halobacteria archaeon AArc-m2/3/4]
MTAKAAILDEGVDDWLAVWSEDLSTVSEARGAPKRNRESIKGDRLDEDDGRSADAIGFDQAQSEMEKHAMRYVLEENDETGKEGLVEEFGWEPDDVDALAEMPADAAPV